MPGRHRPSFPGKIACRKVVTASRPIPSPRPTLAFAVLPLPTPKARSYRAGSRGLVPLSSPLSLSSHAKHHHGIASSCPYPPSPSPLESLCVCLTLAVWRRRALLFVRAILRLLCCPAGWLLLAGRGYARQGNNYQGREPDPPTPPIPRVAIYTKPTHIFLDTPKNRTLIIVTIDSLFFAYCDPLSYFPLHQSFPFFKNFSENFSRIYSKIQSTLYFL